MPKYKLVCFDVDGTLIDNLTFSWEVFHNHFGCDSKKREQARNKFFSGAITYLEWANHDIGMWIEKGVTKKDFQDAIRGLKLMEGAVETIHTLKKAGLKLAIISGSVDIILETLLPGYKKLFDDVYFSHLIFDEMGKLTGAKVTEFDMIKKADALRAIIKREGYSLRECVHIGDYLNDVEIAKIAGLSIAFNCSDETLRKTASVVIEGKDLRKVLPYILEK